MSGVYWLASYPKSGNTWFRIFLTNLLGDDEDKLDLNELTTDSIASSRGLVDMYLAFDSADLQFKEIANVRPPVYEWISHEGVEKNESYYIKVHDAYVNEKTGDRFATPNTKQKTIYLVRNPLDVAPSYAHHNGTDVEAAVKEMGKYTALSRSVIRLQDQLVQPMGSWSFHVESWLDHPEANTHVVRYEDMQMRPLETFLAAAEHLDIDTDEDKVARAIEASKFDKIKSKEQESGFREAPSHSQGNFFRQGKSDTWNNDLTEDQRNKVLTDHREIMLRLGYLDEGGNPVSAKDLPPIDPKTGRIR